jgi:rubrerythrin
MKLTSSDKRSLAMALDVAKGRLIELATMSICGAEMVTQQGRILCEQFRIQAILAKKLSLLLERDNGEVEIHDVEHEAVEQAQERAHQDVSERLSRSIDWRMEFRALHRRLEEKLSQGQFDAEPRGPDTSAGWQCPNCGGAHAPDIATCPEPPRNGSLWERLKAARDDQGGF